MARQEGEEASGNEEGGPVVFKAARSFVVMRVTVASRVETERGVQKGASAVRVSQVGCRRWCAFLMYPHEESQVEEWLVRCVQRQGKVDWLTKATREAGNRRDGAGPC